MGFNSVYRSLQELFPQVDTRILKAVAVENAKDPDVAAECIVTDVLPFLEKQSTTQSSFSESRGYESPVSHEQHLPAQAVSTAGEDAKGSDEIESHHAAPTILNYTGNGHIDSTACDVKWGQIAGERDGVKEISLLTASEGLGLKLGHVDPDCAASDLSTSRELSDLNENQEYGVNKGDEMPELQNYRELDAELNVTRTAQPSTLSSDASDHVPVDSMCSDQNVMGCEIDPLSSALDVNTSVHRRELPIQGTGCLEPVEFLELESSSQSNHGDPFNPLHFSPLPDSDQTSGEPGSLQLGVEHQKSSDIQILDVQLSVDAEIEDSPLVNSVVTQSGQVCSIDLLQDIIEDARCHKKKLSSAVDSVMKLMTEVESKEKDVEQAKEQASRGGLEVYESVEKLKEMLKRANEAKEMHSGEVYGERAILATEVRELQNRLLLLQEERDKYLLILDEMRRTLEARKAVAEQEIAVAEQEKLEKEKSAITALNEQELIMQRVVEESNILKEQAEENEKLREFLVDRGRIVDALQGEISVICQDVKSLKEKFDNGVPLSQSLSSTHSTCLVASSTSQKSTRSAASDQSLSEQIQLADDENATQGLLLEKRVMTDGHKELSDDDWEFFEATT